MTGWITALQQQYNLVVYRYEKIPQGIWMETNRGTVVLQSVPSVYAGKEGFIKEIYHHMGQTSFLLPVFHNQEQSMLTSFGDQVYYLTRWPAAESEWLDYGWLGQSSARFHRTSAMALEKCHPRYSDWDTWPKRWKSKTDQLRKFEQIAARRIDTDREDPFDSFVLENYPYLSHLAQLSLTYLHEANYREVCRQTMEWGRLSYIHFGPEQFVVSPQGNVFFVDPFSWVEDMRVRDIAQFIKADVRDQGWNPQHIYSFLCGYQSVSPLMPEEFIIMYALFLLPGRMMKKLETVYYRPHLLQSEDHSIELFRDETSEISPYQAYAEMKRNEILLREFPRLARECYGILIPSIK